MHFLHVAAAHRWPLVTIQRPAVCGRDMKEVHDVTLIQVMRHKNKKR